MTSTRSYRTTQERRAEIIDATVRVLAEQGFAAASFARIRETAELSSTRMISYHFADKGALMGALVEHVVHRAAAVMVPAIEAEPTWAGKLAAYLRSNLHFLAENRLAARAVIEVIRNAPRADNDLREDTSALLLSVLLAQGQEAGEFRAFDPVVVARSIRATIDAFAMTMPSDKAATTSAIDEIVAMYHRATRPEEGVRS
ncbi:TetR family transcriptional regulator [Microbacterium sp. Au-Mic1]|uniref:TetR/AcrR family transcriptional regulator n=1 Tax=Microbacterium sp. Au-Mic1 TaxID=2906457 RepID=UPI001E5C50B0|nr:TetR/AcrR family transcriptional regulator [Microbacterium sp. Au-Mic1]MCE4027269.1 TetR family transcriptional regulator [Microbacterium sp. Au-Mic1]